MMPPNGGIIFKKKKNNHRTYWPLWLTKCIVDINYIPILRLWNHKHTQKKKIIHFLVRAHAWIRLGKKFHQFYYYVLYTTTTTTTTTR